ncbi:MAG: CRISPR system precrRNA processing endoribonuclease RAMP protein Cas6 [Planctomycetota bacterium]|nr:MAG: CRISPR system precrRNA processing endoribonuclease RAMP protein Cas6 [Planctomycetota bacterium]
MNIAPCCFGMAPLPCAVMIKTDRWIENARSIPITTLHWQVRLSEAGRLPRWKGSLLRGALGWALKVVAGGAPAPAWPGCSESFYVAVFEPQNGWKSPRAVPLWNLSCSDRREQMHAGDCITGHLHCLGPWPEWALQIWEEAFRHAVHTGLGEKRLQAELTRWQVEAGVTPPPVPPCDHIRSLELHTISPCRLKEQDRDLHELNGPCIARSLVRRLRALCIQTMDEDLFGDDRGLWYHHASSQLLQSAGESHRVSLERNSARQKRKHPMPALAGWLRLECSDWQPWAWLFALAPWLHIGRQPHFGLGAVDVRWLTTETPLSEINHADPSHDISALEHPRQ